RPTPPLHIFSLSILRRPPRPTPFPYTTLFRSRIANITTPFFRIPATGCIVYLEEVFTAEIDPNAVDFQSLCDPAGNGVPELHVRSEEHTSELQSRENLVCRLLLEKKKAKHTAP